MRELLLGQHHTLTKTIEMNTLCQYLMHRCCKLLVKYMAYVDAELEEIMAFTYSLKKTPTVYQGTSARNCT